MTDGPDDRDENVLQFIARKKPDWQPDVETCQALIDEYGPQAMVRAFKCAFARKSFMTWTAADGCAELSKRKIAMEDSADELTNWCMKIFEQVSK